MTPVEAEKVGGRQGPHPGGLVVHIKNVVFCPNHRDKPLMSFEWRRDMIRFMFLKDALAA